MSKKEPLIIGGEDIIVTYMIMTATMTTGVR
jgi:hypothetical protein